MVNNPNRKERGPTKLAPTILFGILGEGGFPTDSFLILVLGILCSVFDLIYIGMLRKTKVTPKALANFSPG